MMPVTDAWKFKADAGSVNTMVLFKSKCRMRRGCSAAGAVDGSGTDMEAVGTGTRVCEDRGAKGAGKRQAVRSKM